MRKLNPGGEELHHAKQSISFSAESYITDPPFPPDRMTYVIYHMGPSQTTGRGGKPSSEDAVSSSSLQYSEASRESTADLAREREERGETGERGGESLLLRGISVAVGVCGVEGMRLAEALRSYVLPFHLLNHTVQPVMLLVSPTPILPPLFSPLVKWGVKKG